jgi:hypothetical protein
MGTASDFHPEKLVIGFLTARAERNGELLSLLSTRWGPVDFTSAPIPFGFTDYYAEEMGSSLLRFFVSFVRLVDPSRLAEIKRETNAIEDVFREAGRRRVNLDPGLLCLSRFVLATTKESAHRIPLAAGIYGEVTLLYEKGRFRAVEWTYPDYRSDEYAAILEEIRGIYKRQVRPRG